MDSTYYCFSLLPPSFPPSLAPSFLYSDLLLQQNSLSTGALCERSSEESLWRPCACGDTGVQTGKSPYGDHVHVATLGSRQVLVYTVRRGWEEGGREEWEGGEEGRNEEARRREEGKG